MLNVQVTTRGEVSDDAKEQARSEIGALERFVSRPMLGARVVLIQQANPRIPTPARAEAELDLQDRFILRAPPHRR